MVLRMRKLPHGTQTPVGRLLRILFLRHTAMPANSGVGEKVRGLRLVVASLRVSAMQAVLLIQSNVMV